MTNRSLVAVVFLAGCAVGGASAQLVVPKASAQQAASLTKWEMFCADVTVHNGSMTVSPAERIQQLVMAANKAGMEGWEPVGWDPDPNIRRERLFCFKRSKT